MTCDFYKVNQGLFPLTLGPSPLGRGMIVRRFFWGRELSIAQQVDEQMQAVNFQVNHEGHSLSPRERVRVRGNDAHEMLVSLKLHSAVLKVFNLQKFTDGQAISFSTHNYIL